MKNVMIIGAGSAGTHLAHACYVMGMENIWVVDKDDAAHPRFFQLYKERYGHEDTIRS